MRSRVSAVAVAGLSCLLLTQCINDNFADRTALSKFRIEPNNRFVYDAEAFGPADNLDYREYWLKSWLATNDMCPNGYVVDRIDKVKEYEIMSPVWSASVHGHCK